MMVTCMNDPGTGPTPDPLFNPEYSQFCYEIPFMPGQTQYMDTPVVPTSAFAGAGYNNPDCSYPALTPAISEVDGDGVGPYVSAAGRTLTIRALGAASTARRKRDPQFRQRGMVYEVPGESQPRVAEWPAAFAAFEAREPVRD